MKVGAIATRTWGRGMLRILGIKLRVEGDPPPPGSFVGCNHVSWVDILALGAPYPSTFVAKKEVRDLPLFGFLFKCAGTQFLNRESPRDAVRLGKKLKGLLEEGLTISVFPEGGCADGKELNPFKGSLLSAAAELGAPCVPAVLHYDVEEIVWNDDSAAVSHAKRLFQSMRTKYGGRKIQARIRFGKPIRESCRKKLTADLESAVRKMYEPMGSSS
jgi:1-acyl-sn-glycerol-3-phosphate acyltransferase